MGPSSTIPSSTNATFALGAVSLICARHPLLCPWVVCLSGDPHRYHSHFVAIIVPWRRNLTPFDIISFGRLGK